MKTATVVVLYIATMSISAFATARENTGYSKLPKEERASFMDSLYAVMNDSNITYEEKINRLYKCNYSRELHQEKLLNIINILLPESKEKNDANAILCEYTYLANIYAESGDKKLYNKYIDSASLYVKSADNQSILAMYHFLKCVQILSMPYNNPETDEAFLQILDFFDNAEQIPFEVMYPITVCVINQPDTLFASRFVQKTENLLQTKNSPFTLSVYFCMKAIGFYFNYETVRTDNLLDSAIAYTEKSIQIFNSSTEKRLSRQLDCIVLQSYMYIAKYHFWKKETKTDWACINECIEKSKSFGIKDNDYLNSQIKYLEAIACFGKKDYARAEQYILDAEQLFSEQIDKNWNELISPARVLFTTKIDYADLHSQILYAAGKHKEAMRYNREKNDLKLEKHYAEASKLDYIYDTTQTDEQITALKRLNVKQMHYISTFVIISTLLISTISLFWLWYYAAKKNMSTRISLIKAENDEYEMTLKLKEEQVVQMQLEKYDILSERHIKEIELTNKNNIIQELKKEKEKLDNQIQDYIQQINEYETAINATKAVNEDEALFEIIMQDIIKLINKRLPSKKEFIEMFDTISPVFISMLRNVYKGKLSVPYIKYSICFLLGMDVFDVANCFTVEITSVHMMRYRMKKKIGLGNNEDLTIYLRKLNNSVL